jgi:hypothetical protein
MTGLLHKYLQSLVQSGTPITYRHRPPFRSVCQRQTQEFHNYIIRESCPIFRYLPQTEIEGLNRISRVNDSLVARLHIARLSNNSL